MSLPLTQDEQKFEQLKANFFLCVTEVLQVLVDYLNHTEISEFEEVNAEAYGSRQTVQQWFMDNQRPIIKAGDLSKMNIATCYTFLQWDVNCNLEPPNSEKWNDENAYGKGKSVEYQITSMIRQLFHIAYSKDGYNILQQFTKWEQLINTIHEMESVFEKQFKMKPNLLEYFTLREDMKENFDLSEYEAALDFIVKRDIFETLKDLEESLVYFSSIKYFSNFKVRNLDTDELIPYTGIFDWKDKDGQIPQIFVICAKRAVGKTIYMKYLYQQLYCNPPMFIKSSFIGFDQFELVIFIESMNNSSFCFAEYINSTHQNTMKRLELSSSEIQDIILHYKLLIMIDSFEVATEATHLFLKELLAISSNNLTLMIATRPDSFDDLCEKLPKNKKTIVLFPEANTMSSMENESKEKVSEFEGDTNSDTISLEIPPDYETSKASKVLKDLDQLTKELSKCELLAIGGKIPRDKKKPNAKIIETVASKIGNLIEHLQKAADQLVKYESDEECQLQEILDEYEEIQEEAYVLNKKLPLIVRAELFKLGSESIYSGFLYWHERLCGDPSISHEMLDKMDNNYAKMKNQIHKSERSINQVHKKPDHSLVVDSTNAIFAFRRQAVEAVSMIKDKEGITDEKTNRKLLELVINIRNLRERCDMFNESLPKVIMYNYLFDKNYIGLFAGLEYFLCLLEIEMEGPSPSLTPDLISQLDDADMKIRKHLSKPAKPTQPKLVKSWKSNSSSGYKKKNTMKKAKTKKMGW